jgi:hypothetical protein
MPSARAEARRPLSVCPALRDAVGFTPGPYIQRGQPLCQGIGTFLLLFYENVTP